MINQEIRTLTLSRSDMLRVHQALTSVIWDFKDEIRNPNTSETRRKICESSVEMWERIRSEAKAQMDKQDRETTGTHN